MLQFLYVVLPKQSFGSSTGQGERASVERPFAAGRLHDAVSLGQREMDSKTDVSFCLFHVTLDEERLRPPSEPGDTCFAQKSYLNPVECYPLMPHDLTEQMSENDLKIIMQALRTFHDYLHITHKTMNHTQRLSNTHPSLILGQSIQSLDSGFYLAVT
jgi:hypothetical protein